MTESSYSAGDIYELKVQMVEWRDYPTEHRDITVSLYSSQTVLIKDANGDNYQEHYDGSLPTGFTESTYRGMPSDEEEEEVIEEEEEKVPETLGEVFA